MCFATEKIGGTDHLRASMENLQANPTNHSGGDWAPLILLDRFAAWLSFVTKPPFPQLVKLD